MKLEHVALLVADPPAMARWYVEHLGMKVVKRGDEPPGFARFLADDAGESILETYASDVHSVPDYRGMDPALLHVAFSTEEIEGERDRLVAAGATPVGEITQNAAGDRFAMLRDPWGLAFQLAQRVRPLVGGRTGGMVVTEGIKGAAMDVPSADIGLVGLAVMGENLVLNMESRGFTVAVFNRSVDKVEAFVSGRAKGKKIVGARSLAELVATLKRPRRVMLMVKAGRPVDDLIDQLLPLLAPGDIVIDGGNSHFPDSIRRTKELEAKGFLFVGTGVSGGEEGALKGPSIMPGGSPAAWPHVAPIFQAIAAKVEDGTPCCDWVGDGGAGHFVKMVHNGIEYGDMQLICEAYQMMSQLLGMEAPGMHEVFARWNRGDLDSYLVEITRDILAFQDEDGRPLVDSILDTAGQKGTGKWTSVAALDLGVPLTLISEAVWGRCLSAMKDERIAASRLLAGPGTAFQGDRAAFLDDLEKALYASKLVSYAQGFALMRAAAHEHGWSLKYGSIALLWRGGCIIRSAFLGKIKEAYDASPDLPNLLLDPYFRGKVEEAQAAWRRVVSAAVLGGVWVPAFATALSYYDGYRSARLPANLLQAQRDYFGAHQYERVDRPRGEFFHTNWTGRGGATASSTYGA